MARVTVVVIVFNDADRLPVAVRSVLAQSLADVDVVIVDDHSPDRSYEVARELAAAHPGRVRAVRLDENSGSGGEPRNRGIAEATGEFVMFLDSDDVLEPDAAELLVAAARRHDADVASGTCLRVELPGGRTSVWAPQLYDVAAGAKLPGTVLDGIGGHPEMLWDTLVVNKLYRRDFLTRTGLRFPSGLLYEDFVFTGRLYAARPRIAVIGAPVYRWHVRRDAASLSVSLHRSVVENWQDRVTAHSMVVSDLTDAGLTRLADQARAKFLDYDLPMYLRELPQRSASYRAAWWQITRTHLAGFPAAAVERARPVSRWLAAAVGQLSAVPSGPELGRLVELSAVPPRLVPPYQGDAQAPVLEVGTASVPLDGLTDLPADLLPVAVEGTVTVGSTVRVTVLVRELYGRLAAFGPQSVRLELAERSGLRPSITAEGDLRQVPGGWAAHVSFAARDLSMPGRLTSWSVWARVAYADGSATETEVRAGAGQRTRRDAVLLRPGRVLLVQTHVTPRRALLFRGASGMDGVRRAVGSARRRLISR
ncbi:glycosyltransferase family 2 protein [Actinacidiphila acidipaludis]|uniref:Glycosyltransferase n=1 Tax=Actinacidiphila acidipaludis TaxID=2873382 RepID=A0ABS7Q788_9ACTN|nr:glycosyltransferase family 2 protein [Streptomyces acidipaludis]MBY8877649.1 glycosyltransferase [Streptomyces acidipaludis]